MNRPGLSDDLVDALAAHDVPDTETILRLLKELEPAQGWLEVLLIDLAGRRRLKEAVPLLCERTDGEDFLTPARAADALVRIGDPDVARLLLEKSRSSNEYFRLEAARVLGGIKHESSEAALLELLERETVDWARTWICSAICDLISERAVDAVRKELASGSDEQYRELASPALAVVTMLGLPRPPEAELWESVQREQQERMRRFRADSRLETSEGLSDLVGEEPADGPADSVTAPIRKTAYRVGRNDPCPCGSGKKFKKCCGRSA
jgi:HEAT repeat protein